MARFDRNSKDRKTSNKEWHNPNDPDAKVGSTKDGACGMIHKSEHIVNLESFPVIAAEFRPGDSKDTEDLSIRSRCGTKTGKLPSTPPAAFKFSWNNRRSRFDNLSKPNYPEKP